MESTGPSVPPHILEQAQLLRRGTADIVPAGGLEEKLALAKKEGRPLRVKLGLDPTAPDIHLGFAVVLRKLRQFQDMGHQVILIIGDYTALIGDPSGRSATRPMLSPEQIQENAATYVDQLARILDRSRTSVRFNSEWLGKLDFAELIRLASRMTVAQILQRDDFARRYEEHAPISLHELFYPLAQAYDSVAIEADIEMGGQDQTFNILAGRHLQKELGQAEQIGFFMPLLVGLDGVKKMSKSLGNYVGIAEPPLAMVSKILSLPDELMRDYFVLATDVPLDEVSALLAAPERGAANPKDVKRRLAREIAAIYHGRDAADAADAEWNRIHSGGELPSEIPVARVSAAEARDGKLWICKLLVAAGMARGTAEGRRLVEQGGVMLGEERITDPATDVPLEKLQGAVLRVGPKRFVRVEVE